MPNDLEQIVLSWQEQSLHGNAVGIVRHTLAVETFKKRLRALIQRRLDEGVFGSEADLARALGISPRRLNQYSTGRSVPIDFCLLSKICEALGTHPNYLFGWSEEVAPIYADNISKIASLEAQILELRTVMAGLITRKTLDKN